MGFGSGLIFCTVVGCYCVWCCCTPSFMMTPRELFSKIYSFITFLANLPFRYAQRFQKRANYTKHWRKWDRAVFSVSSTFFVTGLVAVSFGIANCIGPISKLLSDSELPLITIIVGSSMIMLSALSFDIVRYYLPRWSLICACLLVSLFVGTASVLTFYYDPFEAMEELRFGWTLLDDSTKMKLQETYSCCGFSFYQDNGATPCPSNIPIRGCQMFLEPELQSRISVLEWMNFFLLIVQLLGSLFFIPFAAQFQIHKISVKASLQRQNNESIRDLLLESADLRAGNAVVGKSLNKKNKFVNKEEEQRTVLRPTGGDEEEESSMSYVLSNSSAKANF
eukprot:g3266.t1